MSKIIAPDWLLDELAEDIDEAMDQDGSGNEHIAKDKLFEILKRYELMRRGD